MKSYKRKPIMSILFLFTALLLLLSGVLQIAAGNGSASIFQILVALLFIYDAYLYMRPYLGMDEEKLYVNNGLVKKETIPLKEITSLEASSKKLILTYKQGSMTRRVNILLSHLRQQDRERFLNELKSVATSEAKGL